MTFPEFVRDVWPLFDKPWPSVDTHYRDTHHGQCPSPSDRALAFWRLFNLSRVVEAPQHNPRQFASHDYRASVQDLWEPEHPPIQTLPLDLGNRVPLGHSRLDQRCFADDNGAYAALGATFMYAARSAYVDEGRLAANLDWLSSNGCNYIRVLLMVGSKPYWPFEIQPKSWGLYHRVLQLAWDRQMRIQPVLFADAQVMMPDNRDDFTKEVAQWSNDNREQIQFLEVANESSMNGVDEVELAEYCRVLEHQTDIPFASSSPSGSHEPGEALEELYGGFGCRSPLATPHFDRTFREDGYRIVRQPWHYQYWGHSSYMPRAWVNNEPAGVGDKQGGVTLPEQVGMGALYTFLSGGAGYCFHSGAGVKGLRDDNQTRLNFEDIWRGPEMWESMRSMVSILPSNISNGEAANHHWTTPQHPLEPSLNDQIWPDGRDQGVVRAISRGFGGEHYIGLLGILNYVDITPNRGVSATLYHPVSGGVMWTRSIPEGEAVRIHQDGETRSYLLKLVDS